MKQLPGDLKAYKRTPVFDQASVPKGLLNDHSTKLGVWGLIVIESGSLEYTIIEPAEVVVLTSNLSGVVEPTVLHKIKPLEDVRFYVEFYR